jgi:uncharacterized protein (TIGR00369 family)
MALFDAEDQNFEARVRASFAQQSLHRTIGATVTKVAPGEVEIEIPFREDLGQQHGFMHGGIVAAIVDTACGYAALSLLPPDVEVLTVEFKINFVAPAKGERLIARGRVTKPGRTLTVCRGDVVATTGAQEKLVATMLATIMVVSRERGEASSDQNDHAVSPHRPIRKMGVDQSRQRARTWGVCRGQGLRQTFREFAGIGW